MDSHLVLTDILRAVLNGESPVLPELNAADWQALFRLADAHKLTAVIHQAVYTHPAFLRSTDEFRTGLSRTTRETVMRQSLKTADFLRLYTQLEARGLRPLVVKGIVCRSLWPAPDLRPSGDEDLLIPPEQFPLYDAALRELGFAPVSEEAAASDSYEIAYRSPKSPLLIELHRQLFPPGSSAYGWLNDWFANVSDTAVPVTVDGITVWTPAPTPHMLYLLCHAFKHFVHSGVGIRQTADIALMANAFGSEIDWAWIETPLRRMQADCWAAAMLKIGVQTLRLDPEKACLPDTLLPADIDTAPLLADILSGALYGANTMARQHSGNVTLAAVEQQHGDTSRGLLRTLFPPKAALLHRYPYLNKYPLLLPAAWLQRLGGYCRSSRRENRSLTESYTIGQQRAALLWQYRVLR